MKHKLPILALALFLAYPTPSPASSKELVSLDLVRSDLIDVLRYFSEVARVNLVVDPSIRGEVTMRLIDVPWEEALEVVLRVHGLASEYGDGVLYIAPISVLIQREAEAAALRAAELEAAPLTTVVARVSYADPEDVARVIRETALSSRGSVVVDRRTATLIITDVASELARSRRVLSRLDR